MKRLIWARQAQDDLRAITSHYQEIDAGLPLTLIDRIERAAVVLLDFPQLGPSLPDSSVRLWRARGTPHLIFYRAVAGDIRILKVRHAVTDWQPRR